MSYRFPVAVIIAVLLFFLSVTNTAQVRNFDVGQASVTPTILPTITTPITALSPVTGTEAPVAPTMGTSPINGAWILELLKILSSSFLELLKVICAWPVILGIALLSFYKPLAKFLSDMGQRATKISIAQFSVELPASQGPPPIWTGSQLTEALQSSVTASGAKDLTNQFSTPYYFDHLIVDIEDGDKWLTSRLFLFTTMLQRMNNLRCVVFLYTKDHKPRTFLGVAHAEEVRWVLAQKYPWLEAAYTTAYAKNSPSVKNETGTPVKVGHYIWSDSGDLGASKASKIAKTFLEAIQFRKNQDPGTLLPPELQSFPEQWERLEPKPPEFPYWERGRWLTEERIRNDLQSILLIDAYVINSPELSSTKRQKAIINRPGRFVALVKEEKIFERLINRQALLEDIGRTLAKPVDD